MQLSESYRIEITGHGVNDVIDLLDVETESGAFTAYDRLVLTQVKGTAIKLVRVSTAVIATSSKA